MTWTELNTVPRTYVVTVTLIGFAIITWSLPEIVRTDHPLLAVLFVLAVPVSLVKVTLPGTASTISLSHVLGYLALFTLGTSSAVAVTVAGAWTQCTFRSRQRSPAYETLFSIATLALAMELSGTVFEALGGMQTGGDATALLIPFAAATTVFFVLNTVFVAVAIAVTTAQPIARLWCDTFLSTWPAYLLGAAVAAGSHLAIEHTGPWLVVFLTVPLAVAFHNLRVYLQRVDEASTDALTGLSNQRFVLAHGPRELSRAARHGNGVTVVVVDLDELKSINDTYGHHAGDLALCDVARSMRACIRSHDVCARYGGDEFVLVLGHCDAAAGIAKARHVQETVDASTIVVRPGVLTRVGVSIGTASYPDDGESLEQLIETADARMYDDKLRRRALRAIPADVLEPSI